MDILLRLERILIEVPENVFVVPPVPRTVMAAAVTEIRRLRAINAGLVAQLNGLQATGEQGCE
jgi:hypothetical protein